MTVLLTPRDVDRLFCYPTGRAARLARSGKLPHILLPDGSVRFRAAEIEKLLLNQRRERAQAVNGAPPLAATS